MKYRRVLLTLAIALALLAVVLWLTGCASDSVYDIAINPTTGKGTATVSAVALVVPVVGWKMAEATVVLPPDGMSIWGIVGLVLGGSAGLTTLLPKGWDLWRTIFAKGVPVKEKLLAAVALPLPALPRPPHATKLQAARVKARQSKET